MKICHRRAVFHGAIMAHDCSPAASRERSMRVALVDLNLERLVMLYPGTRRYAIEDRVEAIPLAAVADDADALWPPHGRRRRQRRL
jgi:hypothetical protein